MTVGKALQWWRTATRMSQDDLAKQAQVSKGMISLIERDLRQPSMQMVKSLTGAMSVPLIYLAFLMDDRATLPPNLRDQISLELFNVSTNTTMQN